MFVRISCLCFLPTVSYILAKPFNLVFFHLRNTDKCVHFSASETPNHHICFHFLTHRLKYCITSPAGSYQKITLTSNCTKKKKNPEQQIHNTFKLLFWLLYYRFSMISVLWLFSSHIISYKRCPFSHVAHSSRNLFDVHRCIASWIFCPHLLKQLQALQRKNFCKSLIRDPVCK